MRPHPWTLKKTEAGKKNGENIPNISVKIKNKMVFKRTVFYSEYDGSSV
jgi:hypothetical protein